MKRLKLALLLVPALAASACTVAGEAAEGRTKVVVGYQSKTINTVTAGTLLRSLGYFEKNLEKDLGGKYQVVWQDYESGAPITAEMLAGKIDIGSVADAPFGVAFEPDLAHFTPVDDWRYASLESVSAG